MTGARYCETAAASTDEAATIADLFAQCFADSEGPDEGAMIGALVATLLASPADQRRVFVAHDGGALVGGVVFTPLHFAGDARRVMLLSPMAVATAHQGRGLGQGLIRHALSTLRAQGVDVAVTYGDPAFYGRTGFRPVTTDDVPSPQPLNMPQGWIAQSLDGAHLAPLPGPCTCHPAFNDPALW
ncbi:MAG: N-acetyltransferase [Paracoccaceae bacterium]